MATKEVVVRIGDWYVEYAKNKRNPDRLRFLRDNPADIWVLTETHQSLDLSTTHTPYLSTPRPPVRHVDSESTWVTIWSRFNLHRRLDVPDPCRQVAAILATPIGKLAIAGVVIPWHCDRGDRNTVEPIEPLPCNWSEHTRVLKNEIPTLFDTLSNEEDCHIAFAGDLNTDLSPPYSRNSYGPSIAGRQMWHEHFKQRNLVCHTKDLCYPDPPMRKFIDHICTDLGEPVDLQTWSGDDGIKPRLSDHPGVVATFAVSRVTKSKVGGS